jgi:drug/metabolite transporter (DMT)-like permease
VIEVGGFFGLLLLIAVVYAVINVVQSRVSTGAKVVWVVLVIVLPFLGFIIWLFFGPRSSH